MAGRNGTNGKGRKAAASPATPPANEPAPTYTLRVIARSDEDTGPAAAVMLCRNEETSGALELTRELTSAIAHALWRARGGDSTQNWIDAEKLLDQMLGLPPKAPRPEPKPLPKREAAGPLPEPPLRRVRRSVPVKL